MRKEDIAHILEEVMYEFPLSVVEFYTPKWMDMMSVANPMKQDIIDKLREIMNQIQSVRDLSNQDLQIDSQYVKKCKFDHINIADGTAAYQLDADNQYIMKCSVI